jgi:hypothetical protein
MGGSTRSLKERLDEVDHLGLFQKLLGIDLQLGRTVKSPIRDGDAHPSFNIYRGRTGQVYFKDFAYERGSVYDLAMLIHGIKFADAVKLLAQLAGFEEGSRTWDRVKVAVLSKAVIRQKEVTAWYEPKTWPEGYEGSVAFRYWMNYGITLDHLADRNIYWSEQFSMRTVEEGQDTKIMTWRDGRDSPLFVMCIGSKLKAYLPLKTTRPRYIGTTTMEDVFGAGRLSKQEHLIINAGQKDAVVAEFHMREAGLDIRSIAFNAEGTMPKKETMRNLFNGSNNIWVCYDNDETGIMYSNKLCNEFPFVKRIPFEKLYPKSIKDVADAYRERKNLQPIIDLIHE